MKSILIFRKKFWENSGDNYALKQAFFSTPNRHGVNHAFKKVPLRCPEEPYQCVCGFQRPFFDVSGSIEGGICPSHSDKYDITILMSHIERREEEQVLKDESEDRRTWRETPGTADGPTAMLIRIFGRRDHEPYGDIVHYDLKKPVPYQGSAELVLRIDAISRSLNLPASETTFRSMDKARDGTGNVLPEEYWQEEGAGPTPRVRDTIYLQLIGRQHTSIQGRIWGRVTKKKYITFRSALELIYLLSGAG